MFISSRMEIFRSIKEINQLKIQTYPDTATISPTGFIRESTVELDIQRPTAELVVNIAMLFLVDKRIVQSQIASDRVFIKRTAAEVDPNIVDSVGLVPASEYDTVFKFCAQRKA